MGAQVNKKKLIDSSLINKDLRIFVSQGEKEPREGHCDRSYYYPETIIFVNTTNKQSKIFENSNIYISFLSLKGCSINVKVTFQDPKGHRKQRDAKIYSDDPNFAENPDSDPFKELRRKMKQEQEKIRKQRFKL